MRNDEQQCFCSSNVHCAVVVEVPQEFNLASYFPEAGNLNGSYPDMFSDVAGQSISCSCNLFELSDRS